MMELGHIIPTPYKIAFNITPLAFVEVDDETL